jgi:hypothetical protein
VDSLDGGRNGDPSARPMRSPDPTLAQRAQAATYGRRLHRMVLGVILACGLGRAGSFAAALSTPVRKVETLDFARWQGFAE